MNKRLAWFSALGLTAALVVGAVIALGQSDGGERDATAVPAATSGETAGSGVGSAPTASPATAAQVQQVLAGIMTRIPQATTGTNGELRAQTPQEVEEELRVELAKIGLYP